MNVKIVVKKRIETNKKINYERGYINEGLKTKKCSTCKEIKFLFGFNKNISSCNGFCNECKDCYKKRIETNKKINSEREYTNEELNSKTKKCSICGEIKFLFRFNKDMSTYDGFKTRCKDCINEYNKKKYHTNSSYKITKILRRRIRDSIKSQKTSKCGHTEKLLGCFFKEAHEYIESLFLEGMIWDNHGYGPGKWNIDHIIPLSSFDLTKEENQRKAFHYTNLQPLWHEDNMEKGDSLDPKYRLRGKVA